MRQTTIGSITEWECSLLCGRRGGNLRGECNGKGSLRFGDGKGQGIEPRGRKRQGRQRSWLVNAAARLLFRPQGLLSFRGDAGLWMVQQDLLLLLWCHAALIEVCGGLLSPLPLGLFRGFWDCRPLLEHARWEGGGWENPIAGLTSNVPASRQDPMKIISRDSGLVARPASLIPHKHDEPPALNTVWRRGGSPRSVRYPPVTNGPKN